MGQSAAETLKEIEDVRGRLEAQLRVLEQRLPSAALMGKRAAGIALGGGMGGTLFWFAIRRARGRAGRRVSGGRAQTIIQLVTPEQLEALQISRGDGRAGTIALAAAGALLAVQVVELRQLRRLSRSMSGEGA